MMNEINFGHRKVGPSHPPFIVAEMSGNHNQSLDRALQIVDAASQAGAHALKIQTYTADTMTIDLSENEFFISESGSLWQGKSLYELYSKAYTPWEWHEHIFERCRDLGLLCFSSPFDETAVDFLMQFDIPCFKIASFENTDIPLIKKVAATGKPMIISTGMATVSELDETIRAALDSGCDDILLLKCTSSYPAQPTNTNLRTIPHMRELFDCQVGISDHTLGIGVAVASVAFGATLIEKHFTLNRADGGVDSQFSLEPEELKALSMESERAWKSIGDTTYGPTDDETKTLSFRRSLYVVQDISAGETFTEDNVRRIRPGLGLPPKYYETVLGKKARKNIKRGTPLTWNHF